jgi:hypothetical protein
MIEDLDAYTIPEFCRRNGNMSQAMYFKLQVQGEGPREMKVGRRKMISKEASAEWRRSREEAAAKSEPANAA